MQSVSDNPKDKKAKIVLNELYKTWEQFLELKEGVLERRIFEIPIEKALMGYYLRVLTLVEDIIFLSKNERYLACFVLNRSAFEAYVNLANLVKDADFLVVLEAEELNDKRRLYKNYEEKNPYYGNLSKEVAEKHEKEISARLKELRRICKNKKLPTKFKEKLEAIDFIDAYSTIYNEFSTHVHGTLSSLQRHVQDGYFSLQAQLTQTNKVFVAQSSINLAIGAAIQIMGYFNRDIKPFQQLLAATKKIALKVKASK